MNVLFRTVVKHISTGADGETYDVGRIIGWVGSVLYLLMGLAELTACLARGEHFPFNDYGIGFGAFTAGTGALLLMKQGSEPKATAP